MTLQLTMKPAEWKVEVLRSDCFRRVIWSLSGSSPVYQSASDLSIRAFTLVRQHANIHPTQLGIYVSMAVIGASLRAGMRKDSLRRLQPLSKVGTRIDITLPLRSHPVSTMTLSAL